MGSNLPVPASFPPPLHGSVDLLVIAGEHSGDQQAARMLRGALGRNPDLKVAAFGGAELAGAGAQLLFDLTESSVVGLVEVVRNYGFFRHIFNQTLRWIETHRPRAVCLVDYPGFNLRLARALFESGLSRKGGGTVKVLYYISPQIWAWKAGRRFTMASHLDALAVIFPFEVGCYADTGLPVDFVGHPFLSEDPAAVLPEHDRDGPILLLPGSRRAAVSRIAPVLLDAYARYRAEGGDREAIIVTPGPEIRSLVEDLLAGHFRAPLPVGLIFRDQKVAGAAVLTSSGTMSLACALAGIPGAIAYRANLLTYLIARRVIRVPYLGIANLILDTPLYPEYLQGAARPGALAREIRSALGDSDRLERTRKGAAELRARLHKPETGGAADWLVSRLDSG